MAINVGQGVLAQMQAQGDSPARDSIFGRNADGTDWEQGYGFKGVYVASNASGAWQTSGPLPVAPA